MAKAKIPLMRGLLKRAGFRIRNAKRADCAHCTGNSTGTVSYTGEVAYCHRCHWTANAVTLAKQFGLRRSSGAKAPGDRRHLLSGLKARPTRHRADLAASDPQGFAPTHRHRAGLAASFVGRGCSSARSFVGRGFSRDIPGRKEKGALAPEVRKQIEQEALVAAFETWVKEKTNEVFAHLRAMRRQERIAHMLLPGWPEDDELWDRLAEVYHQEAAVQQTIDFLMCLKLSVWLEDDATLADVFQLWRSLGSRNAA